MSLWILFMSQHLNPPSALSDHCESVAGLISNGPHSVAYCYKLGPNRVKAECLCLQKAATIFQLPTQSHNSRLRLATATNHQGYEDLCDAHIKCRVVSSIPPWLGFIVSERHAVPTQCARSAHIVRTQCPHSAHAVPT